MKIKIENLTFNCIIGILPFEREKEQRVIINCSFKYKYENQNFIDYSEIALLIKEIMIKNRFQLIEEALETLNKKLKSKYLLKKLKISIKKPDILSDCEVSVTL